MLTRLIAIFTIILIAIGIYVFGQMKSLNDELSKARLNTVPKVSLLDPEALVGTCVGHVPFVLKAGFFDPTQYETAGSRGTGLSFTGRNITPEYPEMICSQKNKLPEAGISGGTRLAFCLPFAGGDLLNPNNYANDATMRPCQTSLDDEDYRYRFVVFQIDWPFISPPEGHIMLRPFEAKTQKRVSEYDGHIYKREGDTSLAISCRLSSYPRVDKRQARWCRGKIYDHSEKLMLDITYASPSENEDNEAWRAPVKHAIALARHGHLAGRTQ